MSITINGTTGIAGVDGSAATPSVQGADTNTGVFFPAADTVALTTGGSERMRVTSAGLVGIGTTPTTLLHLSGSAAAGQDPTVTLANTTATTGRTYQIISGDGGPFRIQDGTAAAERMRIDSSGNVGIGTSSPGTKLDVAGTITARATSGEGGEIAFNNIGDASVGLVVDVSSADVGRIFQTANNSTLQIGQLGGTGGIVSLYTAATERLRIASAGQIGIGGANYGTSGQVLTSGGSGAAPSWTSRGFASATLTDKTGSRANSTTYQNTTTGWLFVSVRDSNNGQSFSVGPSSASLTIFNTNIAPGTAIGLVPPSYYYSISGSVLQSWYEGQA